MKKSCVRVSVLAAGVAGVVTGLGGVPAQADQPPAPGQAWTVTVPRSAPPAAPGAGSSAWTATPLQVSGPSVSPGVPVTLSSPGRHHGVSRSGVRAPLGWQASQVCRPLAPAPAQSGAQAGARAGGVAGVWRVRSGDTLGLVARCSGAGVERIAAASGVADPDVIRVGQLLTVPVAGR